MARPTRWWVLDLAAVVALVLALAGCGGGTEEVTPVDDLDARPTLAAIEGEYAAMRQEMTGALDDAFGPNTWQVRPDAIERSRAACDEDPNGPGTSSSWAPLFAEEVPERPDWERAVEMVDQVGARYGFGGQRVLIDGPGGVLVAAEDMYGGLYELGIARRMVLTIRTGCHLDQPAEGASVPSATPD
ncbi:MAG: LppA family lipoprotein [Nocardioides sp.]|nr:LppA family lipoprotein [Nocardioides sp.]